MKTRQSFPNRPKFFWPKQDRLKISRVQLARPNNSILINRLAQVVKLISKKTVLSGLSVGLLIGLIVFAARTTTISAINCASQYGPCPADVTERLGEFQGQNVLISRLKISRVIRSNFPAVVETKAWIKDKNTLGLEIVLDQPVAAVTTDRLLQIPAYFLVNSEGVVIDQTDRTLLPTLVAQELTTPPGSRLSDSHYLAINIIAQLNTLGHVFAAKQTSTNTLEIELQPSAIFQSTRYLKVLFPLDDQETPDRLVSALQLILTRATIEADRVQIDLRLSQPVIQDLTVTIIPTPTSTDSATISAEPIERL